MIILHLRKDEIEIFIHRSWEIPKKYDNYLYVQNMFIICSKRDKIQIFIHKIKKKEKYPRNNSITYWLLIIHNNRDIMETSKK